MHRLSVVSIEHECTYENRNDTFKRMLRFNRYTLLLQRNGTQEVRSAGSHLQDVMIVLSHLYIMSLFFCHL